MLAVISPVEDSTILCARTMGRSLRVLDFRGNPMCYVPRLDDLPPLNLYREWILTNCPRISKLDGTAITEQEYLYLALNPLLNEPSSDEAYEWPYFGPPQSASLPEIAEMLLNVCDSPSDRCAAPASGTTRQGDH